MLINVRSITGYGDDSKSQLVFNGILNHPKMAPYVKNAGILLEGEKAVMIFNEQKETLTVAAATDNPRGHPNDDQSKFI